MPSCLLLNSQSTALYINSLKKASADVKLGVNKSVNLEMKSVVIRHMDGGLSKIIRVNFHPSNPIKQGRSTSTIPLNFG